MTPSPLPPPEQPETGRGDRGAQTGPDATKGSPAEVFAAFLKLGLTSFGGPIAHLGYFRAEFVEKRRWLDDRAYAELVALCQFLPGPASSQTGFALGLMRAGWWGALAAFATFTLPSAIVLLALALGAAHVSGPLVSGALHGLGIVAVAIVAQAVWGMARSLCPDPGRASIAAAAVALGAFVPGWAGMIGAIFLGAAIGYARGPFAPVPSGPDPTGNGAGFAVTQRMGIAALAVFAALLLILPVLAPLAQGWAVFDGFYRAGALVFGGGHVVLPLLQAETVASGRIGAEEFLAGYGAAQAVPGPLFTFAAYLGALVSPAPYAVIGAATALFAVFLPGFLLLIAALPFWQALRARPSAQAVMQGANAAVVGILGAALYAPVMTEGLGSARDFALALACFVLLTQWRLAPWIVVLVAALGGIGLRAIA